MSMSRIFGFLALLSCLLAVEAYKLSKLELVCGHDYHDWYIDGVPCLESDTPCGDLGRRWEAATHEGCGCGSGRFTAEASSTNLYYEEKGVASYSCNFGKIIKDDEHNERVYQCDILSPMLDA